MQKSSIPRPCAEQELLCSSFYQWQLALEKQVTLSWLAIPVLIFLSYPDMDI